MEFDYSKLLGKIKELYGTQERFANRMGISMVTLSNKINNKSEFTQNQMTMACELLEIPLTTISDYFFKPKVKET